MIKYLSDKLEQWSTKGLKLPFVHDPVTDKPSVTLMFPYIMFVILVISIILLHFYPSMIVASTFTGIIWATSVIFYLIRKIHKSKINLSEGSFSIESNKGNE